jgi:O-antigen ligase
MQRSLACEISREGALIGKSITLILMGNALLRLEGTDGGYLVPYAPFVMLALQVGIPLLLASVMRMRLDRFRGLLSIWYVLLIWSMFTGYWSEYPELVVQRCLLVFLPPILLLFLLASDPTPLQTFRRVAWGMAFFGGGLGLIGIILFFFGTNSFVSEGRVQVLHLGPLILSQRVYGMPPLLRISSLVGNPNTLALWLLVSISATLYLVFDAKRSDRRLFPVLAAQILALILTFSRGGIGAFLLMLLTLWISGRRTVTSKASHAVVAAMLLAAIVFLLFPRAEFLGDKRFSFTANMRTDVWAPTMDSFLERPIRGVGFGVTYESILEPKGSELSSHSAHLSLLAEIGVIGYMLFLGIWMYPFVARLSRGDRAGMDIYCRVVLALNVALFAHQFFENSLMRYGFHTFFWFYGLALVLRTGGIHKEKHWSLR